LSTTEADEVARTSGKAAGALGRQRERIDGIDRQIIGLLNKRAAVAQAIGSIKKASGMEVVDPAREEQVLARVERANPGPFPNESLRSIYREIFSASHHLEEPLAVAYFGPQGTFTHQACRRFFGAAARAVPKPSIREVFRAVEREEVSFGVVPVENSTEGVVNHTLDMFLESPLLICGEAVLVVHHHLLSRSGRAADVRVIASHPQPIAQCAEWLQEHMPGQPTREVSSTAEAARLAAEDPKVAAIASRLAGDLHGLRAIRRNIEDRHDNVTRFLVVSRSAHEPTGRDTTSILFSIKDRVGALHDILLPFADARINLTKIESRPSRRRAWDYVFFVDFDGHLADPAVQRVLARVRRSCSVLKVLGSYPTNREARER
jgi:chorismate mutase/prephenate dehydratase